MNHITGNTDPRYRFFMVNPKNRKYPKRRVWASSNSHAFKKYLENEGQRAHSTQRIDYVIL